MTDAELITFARLHADPVVVETSDAIQSIYAHMNGQSESAVVNVYRMLLMGAVGVLRQAGQPDRVIAANLRAYADQIDIEAATEDTRQ